MKYFLNNDICYLIRKQYVSLLCFLIAPVVLLLLRLQVEGNMSMILLEPIGGFLNFESLDIIMLIMYLFNVATLIYFGIVLYTRDLDDNLENIFLRMSSCSYIIKKEITFIGIIILLKVIQYSLMIGTLFLFSSSTFDSNVFLLLGVDIVYHILFTSSILLLYFLFLLQNKNHILLAILLLIILFIIPKNIWNLRNMLGIFIWIIIMIQGIIVMIFTKKTKKLIENV